MALFRRRFPALLLILSLILALAACGSREESSSAAESSAEPPAGIEAGVAYIKSLEARDPEMVTRILREKRRQELQQTLDSRLRELEDGTLDVWSQFQDYVLLGDSRGVGYYVFDCLPEERVLAEAGATIRNLQEHIPDIKKLDPASIYCCYGLNDVSIGFWTDPQSYAAEYRQIILEIQQAVPDAKIYISSILPARDPAFDTAEEWRNIPQYSRAVEEVCSEIDGCYYVNCDDLAEKYEDMYEVDGIHLHQDFYPIWATRLISVQYKSELEEARAMEDASAPRTDSPAPEEPEPAETESSAEEATSSAEEA